MCVGVCVFVSSGQLMFFLYATGFGVWFGLEAYVHLQPPSTPPSENLRRGSGGGAAETCRETRSPSRVRADGNKLFSLVVLSFFFHRLFLHFFRLSEEIYGRGERGQEVSRREGGREGGRRGGQGQTEADDCLPRALEGGTQRRRRQKM